MSNFYFSLILFLSIISIIISAEEKAESKKNPTVVNKNMVELDGNIFDQQVFQASKRADKWFIIFFTGNCPYCYHCVKLLNDKIIDHYGDNSKVKFGVVNLDHQKNVWLGVRFNITRVPFIIFIENNRMYHFTQQFDERVVYNFIDEEKNFEDSVSVPEEVNYLTKMRLIYSEFAERCRIKMQSILDKYGINFKWNGGCTLILVILAFFLIMLSESFMMKGVKKLVFGKKMEEVQNNIQDKQEEGKTEGNKNEKDDKDKNKDEENKDKNMKEDGKVKQE